MYLVGGFFALILIVAAIGAFTKGQSGANNSQVDSQFTESDGTAAPIGKIVTVRSDLTVAVTQVEKPESISSSRGATLAPEGGKLVIVYLKVGNTGSDSGDMLRTQFRLTDSQGRTYDELLTPEESGTVNLWSQDRGLDDSASQISPGDSINIAKVFRVAANAEGLRLVVNEKMLAIE
ncbi:MAG: DUF4352 domain-containing protein [Cyanobacteria bacterium J06626_18]